MTNISQSQNTVYIIRKGDMIIKPVIDDYEQTKGSEIWKYDSTIVSSPFKTQKSSNAHVNFMVIAILVKIETQRIAGITSKPPILLTPLFPTYFSLHIQTV